MIRLAALLALAGCATVEPYRDANMDFSSLKAVAVLPLANLTRDQQGAERVRDVLTNQLQAGGAFYVVPPGEISRGISRVGIVNATTPSTEEVVKLGALLKADAVITGVVREYGEMRSGNVASNVISVSLQLVETQTGRVVWSAAVTKGGVGMKERLLGGGGEPMTIITEKAVDELLDKLFR